MKQQSKKFADRKRGGATILCPKCRTPTRVLQTRRQELGEVVRERQCPKCVRVIFTCEQIQAAA